MINLKKTALAVLVLGVSGAASAAMYTPPPAPACQAAGVSVPCESSGWLVGITAIDAKATSESNGLGDNYQPTSHWGYMLSGAYNFGTGNDVNINWTSIHGTDNDLDLTNDPLNVTDLENNFDAVNFEFGQHVDFGDNWNMRFHVGVQYMKLHQTSAQSYLGVDYVTDEFKFSGWGPRAGADVSYDFHNGVSLIANTAMTVLVGNNDDDSSINEGDTLTDREIVPGVDMKLGLNWTNQMSNGDLGLQVGYQVTNYWNINTTGNDNWGFNGIYLGVSWSANA